MKKFNLFSYNPPKKGVSKNDERASVQTDFKGFFVMYGRKFWNLSNLNLLMAVYIVLLAAGMWVLAGIPAAFYSFLAVMVVLFGLFSVGTTYVTRGYVRGDPVYILSDFKYAVKNNWKQGILLGVIDFIVVFLLIFDISFWIGPIEIPLPVSEEIAETSANGAEPEVSETPEYIVDGENSNSENSIAEAENTAEPDETQTAEEQGTERSFFSSVSFYTSLLLLIIYLMMRNYIYIIAVTFKLSVFKILKNSFIFAFLGFKRNILAFAGILAAIAINTAIFVYLPMVGVMLPLLITTATCSFIGAYAAYPVIKKYMITPYYDDEEVSESYDKVFIDRE